jgi:5-methylcytosine-specific restriction endonuclease McrA
MKIKQQIRDKFRNDVFERDGYKCVMCGRSDVKLDAHHITNRKQMPNGGYVKENGITLCDTENGCHLKAETNQFTSEELYQIIKSSYDLAYKKSERL